jgi:hypothetical protein
MNPITEKIFYVNDANENQRLIISAMTANPRTWKVSKYEDMLMGDFGLMRLTFVQEAFNKSIDFVDYNATNPDGSKDVYAMYANYYESSLVPDNDVTSESSLDMCVVSASTNVIKVGGSYKTITVNFYDSFGTDITDTYLSNLSIENWSFYIDGIEVKNGELITVLEQAGTNKIKVKFVGDANYLTKILVVQCAINNIVGQVSLEIVNL